VNAVKFNEYSSVVVSAGYDQSLRAWDCRSHSNEPIQVYLFFLFVYQEFLHGCSLLVLNLAYCSRVLPDLQVIDTFSDSVMSVCLTKSEIIAGSVDGTVRTFDLRIGRYVAL
jgi:mitogen-activated protein kinase organizer 1